MSYIISNLLKKYVDKLPFLCLALIVINLILSSLLEKFNIFENPYTSFISIFLWSLSSLFLCSVILRRKIKVSLIFHSSFLIILLGALLTHICGYSSDVHLRVGEVCDNLKINDEISFVKKNSLPYKIKLDSFKVITYNGTNTPSNYVSYVTIIEKDKSTNELISVNENLNKSGYRIFLKLYDVDEKGCVFSINYDKYGIMVTYLGYFVLLLGIIILFFNKDSKFRNLLKSKFWNEFLVLLIFSQLSNFSVSAQSKTLPSDEANMFGKILIQYNGRITSVETLANDFTNMLYGKNSYKEYSSIQVFLGFLLSRDEWKNEQIIRIKDDKIKNELKIQNDYVSFFDLFSSKGLYKLKELSLNKERTNYKELKLLEEKINYIYSIQSFDILKIIPTKYDIVVSLCSPIEFKDKFKSETENHIEFYFLPKLYEQFKDGKDCKDLIYNFIEFQKMQLGDDAPSEFKLGLEKIYFKSNYLKCCSFILLFLGVVAFIFLIMCKFEKLFSLEYAAITLLFCYVTYFFVLRCIVSGRLPFSNGFETLLSIAWISQFFTIIFSNRVKLLLPFGFMISGFALLTATLNNNDIQITHLLPVLNSPLLNLHVSLMMISYTLLSFTMLSSLYSLFLFLIGREQIQVVYNQKLNMLILYPAIFLLIVGIFIGAIWADISWGSYWSWDPKETWALISLLVYSFVFHTNEIKILQNPIIFHIYIIFAFMFILMTYFGVNYYFGGLHSYAN